CVRANNRGRDFFEVRAFPTLAAENIVRCRKRLQAGLDALARFALRAHTAQAAPYNSLYRTQGILDAVIEFVDQQLAVTLGPYKLGGDPDRKGASDQHQQGAP